MNQTNRAVVGILALIILVGVPVYMFFDPPGTIQDLSRAVAMITLGIFLAFVGTMADISLRR